MEEPKTNHPCLGGQIIVITELSGNLVQKKRKEKKQMHTIPECHTQGSTKMHLRSVKVYRYTTTKGKQF